METELLMMTRLMTMTMTHDHDNASIEPAALYLSLNENEELHEEISRLRKEIEEITIFYSIPGI